MADIAFPQDLREKITQSHYNAAVIRSVDVYSDICAHGKTPFFPDYTDHGSQHVASVLSTARGLITDAAWKLLSANDCAVLALAVLIHDCAMHLSPDGLLRVISGNHSLAEHSLHAGHDWPTMWKEYLFETRRFSKTMLVRLFGDTEPVRVPPADFLDMHGRDYRLVGEFIRRYHGRLVHDFAVTGFPGHEAAIPLLEHLTPDVRAVVGLIAQSHSMDLRVAVERLRDMCFGSLRDYRGIHAVFLMVLLRISDYLDLQVERAPEVILTIKRIRSPFSKVEWTAHHSVLNCDVTCDDPECIAINALPSDAASYWRLLDWITGLQSELDISWAVLGEVYGLHPILKNLGITLRRVRSNVLDSDSLIGKVKYIPCRAGLRLAHHDVLPLLVGPLYSYQPEFGVRELIQNAVDAVRELRQSFPGKHPQDSGKADIIVDLHRNEVGAPVLEITDRGIGMTLRIVTDYFLRIGSTFRSDEEWKKQFETVDGRCTIPRAGRFGIGVLASFLLGPELHVRTKHPNENGIEFALSIQSDNIELLHSATAEGTTIIVELDPAVAAKLEQMPSAWDWYCYSTPRVVRSLYGRELEQAGHVPSPGEGVACYWRRFTTDEFPEIYWSFFDGPPLVVNGIKVHRTTVSDQRSTWKAAVGHFPVPNISIVDPDARLKINLQRTELPYDTIRWTNDLYRDMVKDLCAYSLAFAPSQSVSVYPPDDWYIRKLYPLGRRGTLSTGLSKCPEWFSADEGVGLMDTWALAESGITNLVLIPSSLAYDFSGSFRAKGQAVARIPIGGAEYDFLSFAFGESRELSAVSCQGGLTYLVANLSGSCGARALIDARTVERAKLAIWIRRNAPDARIVYSDSGFFVFSVGECPGYTGDLEAVAKQMTSYVESPAWPSVLVAELFFKEWPNKEPGRLTSLWREYVGAPIIPYDIKDREFHLAGAFEKLGDYVDVWRKLGPNYWELGESG